MIVALAAVLALTGCGGGVPPETTPASFTVHGTVEMGSGWKFSGDNTFCTGEGGFSDITYGGQVAISDASGKTLALGTLTTGTVEANPLRCQFRFRVENVPETGDGIYGVEVTHRGVVKFERSKASEVRLKLGD